MKKLFILSFLLWFFMACGPKTVEKTDYPNQQLKFIRNDVEVANKKQLNCNDLVLFDDHAQFFAQQDLQAVRPDQKFTIYAESLCQYNGRFVTKNYVVQNARSFSIANFISTGAMETPDTYLCTLTVTLTNKDSSSKTYVVENTTINNVPCKPHKVYDGPHHPHEGGGPIDH